MSSLVVPVGLLWVGGTTNVCLTTNASSFHFEPQYPKRGLFVVALRQWHHSGTHCALDLPPLLSQWLVVSEAREEGFPSPPICPRVSAASQFSRGTWGLALSRHQDATSDNILC